ncbi:MAG: hypothetical protein A2Y76_08085 [Planctomycetes bacterium RBG_13_60_9]|nr:MAG: hypothetical protein A2Y76_08085 [Planctomycetes bacterium RBG_13_60_9]
MVIPRATCHSPSRTEGHGTVYGIELLNANEQLQREDIGELVVINEATGEHTNLPLMRAKTG